MSPHQTDRQHFERQIVYARPIFILLALLAVLEQPPAREARRSASFLVAYLTVALLVTQLERLLRKRSWHLPLACDLLALGFFMYISPSTVPVLLTAVKGDIHWIRVVSWLGLTIGTFAGGVGLAFMGDRNRRFSSQIEFFSRI